MKILDSKVTKPEEQKATSVERAQQQTTQAIESLQTALSAYKPGIDDISKTLSDIERAVQRLEEADSSIDPLEISQPITQQLDQLRQSVESYNNSVKRIEIKPKILLKTAPPDLDEINQSFSDLDKKINGLIEGLDLMEKPELKDYLKKILELLEKINKKTWGFIGGGVQTVLQAYEINTGNLVNVTAVESNDLPGVYGILALNADGSSIGSGGGVIETYNRVTASGGTRVTAGGDTRVYAH